MRVLLDAKDLINLVEHDEPISVGEFSAWLRDHDSRVVLTATNITEVAAPIASGGNLLRYRHILNRIQALPHLYLRETTVPRQELEHAQTAFEASVGFEKPDPFVSRWQETLNPDGRPLLANMLVGASLFDLIYCVYQAGPEALLGTRVYGRGLRAQFADDRHLQITAKNLRANFIRMIQTSFHLWRLPEPGNSQRLAEWIYGDPLRCPAIRLRYQVREEFRKNREHAPRDSEMSDFAMICAIPYVDCCTLDKRMWDYVGRATRQLQKAGVQLDYESKVFKSLRGLLSAKVTV